MSCTSKIEAVLLEGFKVVKDNLYKSLNTETGLELKDGKVISLDTFAKAKVSKEFYNSFLGFNKRNNIGQEVDTVSLQQFLYDYSDSFIKDDYSEGYTTPQFYTDVEDGVRFEVSLKDQVDNLINKENKAKYKLNDKREAIQKEFAEKGDKIKKIIAESSIRLTRTLKSKDNRKVLFSNNILTNETLKLFNTYYAIERSLSEEEEFFSGTKEGLEDLVDYIVNIGSAVKVVKEMVNEVDKTKDNAYQEAKELQDTVLNHKGFIQKIVKDQQLENREDEFALLMKEIVSDFESTEANVLDMASKFTIVKAKELLQTPENLERIKFVKDSIANIKSRVPANKKEAFANQNQLKELVKELAELPTDEKLEKDFFKAEDVGLFTSMLMSMADIKLLPFQALDTLLRKVTSVLNSKLKALENSITSNPGVKEFLDTYARTSFGNNETQLIDLIQKMEYIKFDQKQYEADITEGLKPREAWGLIKYSDYRFKSKYNYDVDVKRYLLKASLSQKVHDLKYHNVIEGSAWDDVSDLKNKLQEHELKYYKSRLNLEQQEAQKILNEQVQNVDLETGKLFFYDKDNNYTTNPELGVAPVFTTLGRLKSKFQNKAYKISNNITRNLSPTLDELVAQREALETYRKLRSKAGKEEGSPLWNIAERLSVYSKSMGTFDNSISPEAIETYNQTKSYIEKAYKDNPEAIARWHQIHSTTIFTDEYWEEVAELDKRKGEIYDELNTVNGPDSAKYANIWSDITGIVYPYKDNNRIPDGRRLSKEETLYVGTKYKELSKVESLTEQLVPDEFKDVYKDLQSEIETLTDLTNQFEVKRDIDTGTGIIKAGTTIVDYTRRNTQYYARLEDNTEVVLNANQLRSTLPKVKKDELRKQIEELKTKQLDLLPIEYKELLSELKDINVELRKLRTEDTTDYYDSEYTRQKTLFLHNSDFEIPNSFTNSDGELISRNTNSENFDALYRNSIEATFKFQESEWYINNHHKRFKNSDPNYQWITKYPLNSEHIKSQQPAAHWAIKKELDNSLKDFEGNLLQKEETYANYDNGLNDVQQKFLDYMIGDYEKPGLYLQSQKIYPDNKKMGLRIPAKRRELGFFDLKKGDVTIGTAIQRAKENFDLTLDEGVDEYYGDPTGKQDQFLPVYFTGKVDVDLVSTNTFQTTIDYIKESYRYELMKTDVKPFVDATLAVMQASSPEAHTERLPNNKKKLFEKLGFNLKLFRKDGVDNRLNAFKQFSDMFMFGEYGIYEKGAIGPMSSKFLNRMRNTVSWTTMAGNVTGQPGNFIASVFNQITQTVVKSGKANYSLKDLSIAYGDWTSKYMSNYIQDYDKLGSEKSYITNMADRFNIFDGWYENNLSKTLDRTGAKRILTPSTLFLALNSVETTITFTSFLAAGKNFMVNYDGKQISILKAYEIHNQDSEVFTDPPISEDKILEFQLAIQQINRDVQGAYGNLDRNLLLRTWWGQSAMFMRKWLVPHFIRNYGEGRWTNASGYKEGYFRTTARVLIETLKSFNQFGITRMNTMTEFEQQAFKFTLAQIGIIATTWILLAALLGDDEDDIEDKSWFTQATIYGLYKGKREFESLNFIGGVAEFGLLLNTPFPHLVPYYQNIRRILETFDMNPVNDVPFLVSYKQDGQNSVRNYKEGDLKMWTELLRLFGIRQSKLPTSEGFSRSFESLRNLNRK